MFVIVQRSLRTDGQLQCPPRRHQLTRNRRGIQEAGSAQGLSCDLVSVAAGHKIDQKYFLYHVFFIFFLFLLLILKWNLLLLL